MTTRTRYAAIAFLCVAACTAKSSDDDDGGTSSSRSASASATGGVGATTSSGEGGGASCEPAGGSFECGATSCLTDTQFCVFGDPVLGDTCKPIDGSTCPDCDAVLASYSCGEDYDTVCDGDETTGILVSCE